MRVAADELPLPSEIVRVDCCPATMVVGAKLLLTLGGWPGLTSRLAVVDAPLLPTLVCKAPTPMVLTYGPPETVDVTFTSTVHELLAAMVPPTL